MKMNRASVIALGVIIALIIALLVTQRNEQRNALPAGVPETSATPALITAPGTGMQPNTPANAPTATAPQTAPETPAPFNGLPASPETTPGAATPDANTAPQGMDEENTEELPNGAAQPADAGTEPDMNNVPATEGAETPTEQTGEQPRPQAQPNQ